MMRTGMPRGGIVPKGLDPHTLEPRLSKFQARRIGTLISLVIVLSVLAVFVWTAPLVLNWMAGR